MKIVIGIVLGVVLVFAGETVLIFSSSRIQNMGEAVWRGIAYSWCGDTNYVIDFQRTPHIALKIRCHTAN